MRVAYCPPEAWAEESRCVDEITIENRGRFCEMKGFYLRIGQILVASPRSTGRSAVAFRRSVYDDDDDGERVTK